MNKNNRLTFEEIYKQNERRFYNHIHRLNTRDPHHEFDLSGLFSMWNAYENYQSDEGPLATYFNYIIRDRVKSLPEKQEISPELSNK